MEELISLLERKNLCFRSFHKLCSEFVDEIAKGETAGLEEFQRRRQGLINVLEQLEQEVQRWLEARRGVDQARRRGLWLAGSAAARRLNFHHGTPALSLLSQSTPTL